MRKRFIHICFIVLAFPLCFVAQGKKTKVGSDRLEIVGKWSSYSSMDSTKQEVVEFKPDGSFIEYKNGLPKKGNGKYVLYKDELSIAVKGEVEGTITVKFRVQKKTYGLFLMVFDVNKKQSDGLMWVKLYPWQEK